MPIALTTPVSQDDWNSVQIAWYKVDIDRQMILVEIKHGVLSGETFTEKDRTSVTIQGSDYTSIVGGVPSGSTMYDVNKNALYTWLEANGYAGTH